MTIVLYIVLAIFLLGGAVLFGIVLQLRHHSPDRSGLTFSYARFRTRLFADLIDGLLAFLIILLFLLIFDIFLFKNEEEIFSNLVGFLIFLFNMTYLVGKNGQSWGRKYRKIKVVDYSGKTIGFWKAFFRNIIAGIVSMSFLGLGYLWVIWDREKQSWHDMIMKTYVINVD